MSGRRRQWNGTEEEWRIQHEAEMRKRFMQSDLNIWNDLRFPVGSPLPATLQVIRTSLVEPPVAMQAPAAHPRRVAHAPAAPPAWYRQASRDLVARLEKAGFSVQAYDPASHTILLSRADGSRITILLNGQIAARETGRPQATMMPVNKNLPSTLKVAVR